MALHRYVCVLILTGFLVLPLYAQQEYLFDSITVEDGLSQSSITHIIQDRQGFLWFGTIDGLNRYDGYEFTIYKHDPDNPNSLPGNVILSIYEAPSEPGVLWVGIEGRGVTRFDYATFKADWTLRDEAIGRELVAHGRAGVPMVLVYPADPSAAPNLLPELLTVDGTIRALRSAAGDN